MLRLRIFVPDIKFFDGVKPLEKLIHSQVEVISLQDVKKNPSITKGVELAIWNGHFRSAIADMLERGDLPDLKILLNHGVGVNHLPFDLLKQKGVRVANTPDVLADGTADMAMSLMLASARQLVKGYKWAVESEDRSLFGKLELGQDVSFANLGIIGMGSIGYKVAQRAKSFNMKIHYHNRNQRSKEDEEKVGAQFYPDLVSMLPLCDFVVITCPLTESTKKLIRKEHFHAMKNTAHLINVARGPIVDTDSLVEALKSKEIHAVALDVTDPEPLPAGHPLLGLDNVIITPHWASATVQTRGKMIQLMLDNANAYVTEKKLLTEVHF